MGIISASSKLQINNWSSSKTALFFLFFLLINSFCFPYIIELFGLNPLAVPKYFDVIDSINILSLIIVAPLLESMIFQYLIYIMAKKIKVSNIYFVLVSALCFAVSHWYNFQYIVKAGLSGVLYACLFVLIANKHKKNAHIPLLVTAAVHASHNAFGMIYNYFAQNG